MLETVVASSVLILVVSSLRFALRGRISPRLQYALWGLVLLRLLVPVSLGGSGLSVMNALPTPEAGQDVITLRLGGTAAVNADG